MTVNLDNSSSTHKRTIKNCIREGGIISRQEKKGVTVEDIGSTGKG